MTEGMPNPCQPIGCDNGHHLPGCPYKEVDAVSAYPPELMRPATAVVYFKLMGAFGEDYLIHTVQIPEHQFIGALEFGFVEHGEEKPFQPIVRMPFHTHGTIKKIHTLCSRYDDDITEVEN